ncbi:uncharacterized protein PHACADRAFT_31244 [Phanerochaete carnosa HHB-10118-sp]|uniref:Helicase C-terminal domain-containing protein n=1 Tax=Phanerochaete carnosa (strain HHB-10118-sp) TaxID=650164 RepID=K5W1R5_PHACS|nr:uncharacterized protein PHACADRAFT_31244 [Phanerochaete carnosa HHB-10118-sp]EKM52799.1 hypothetical protein PHACADRAFT_31244 [Phanerochaete carnosa HHB-10118-sp]
MTKARDEKPGKGLNENQFPFYLIRWGRVVTDESHTLRNPQGKKATAYCALRKRAGLALTATPVQNYPCDLYAQLKFLGRDYKNLVKMKDFHEVCQREYQAQGSRVSFNSLKIYSQDVLLECVIHRPKISSSGKPCLSLPGRQDHELHRINLSDGEEEFYRYVLEKHRHNGALAELIRLQQALSDRCAAVCVDPRLMLEKLPPDEGELAEGAQDEDVERIAAEVSRIGRLPTDARGQDAASDVLVAGELPLSIKHLAYLFDESYIPTTIQTVLDILEKISVRSGGADKTIIYSPVYFRGPLKTLSAHLTSIGVGNAVYHGDTKPQERTAALHCAATDDSCRVLLMTIQSGGTGLNITACNNVVFLEPWWNPYLEAKLTVYPRNKLSGASTA